MKFSKNLSFLEEPEPEQLDSDEELIVSDDDDDFMTDPLQAFLAALNLTEYWPLFKKEEMDLEGKNLLGLYLIVIIFDFSGYDGH